MDLHLSVLADLNSFTLTALTESTNINDSTPRLGDALEVLSGRCCSNVLTAVDLQPSTAPLSR